MVNPHDSQHSLNLLYGYENFLGSLDTICDMGCGAGHDITWWATLENQDDPPEPYDFKCYAVDIKQSNLDKVPDLPNIKKVNRDFTEQRILPVSIDLMWAHDSLQYSTNPIETLKFWNEQMTVNGMLVLHVPQHSGVVDNRYYSRTYNNCFYNFTPTNLIYMLAVNGFDCRDAYLLKKFNDPWIKMAVYKTEIEPMNPKTTTWFDLVDKELLNPSIVASIQANGYLKQEDIIMPWLDKENYYIDWIPQRTVIPEEAGEPTIKGNQGTVTKSNESKYQAPDHRSIDQTMLKPTGILKPPKRRYVK